MSLESKKNLKLKLDDTLLDIELTQAIFNQGKDYLKKGIKTEVVSYKLAGDILVSKGKYINALEYYKKAGYTPNNNIIRSAQKTQMFLTDRRFKFKELVSEYGIKYSSNDVKETFIRILKGNPDYFCSSNDVKETFIHILQGNLNYLQTGPSNRGKAKNQIDFLAKETGIYFDRKHIIRMAYINAIKEGYMYCVENVFINTNKTKFIPKTPEELSLVKNLYEKNIKPHLAAPKYVKSIFEITGVSIPYKLLLNTGRKKADEVKEGKLHKDYLKGFVDSTGMKHLGNYLYERAGMTKTSFSISAQKVKRQGILKKLYTFLR